MWEIYDNVCSVAFYCTQPNNPKPKFSVLHERNNKPCVRVHNDMVSNTDLNGLWAC